MKLGDVVLALGSSSSSSSSTSSVADNYGITTINFTCDVDLDNVGSAIKTSDGNYVAACGVGYAYNGIIKFNKDRIIWAKAIVIKDEDTFADGGRVSEIDGYYYATYKFWTSTQSYSSIIIYKFDQDGNEIWHRSSYSCWADDYVFNVIESQDSTSILWITGYYDGGCDFSCGYTPVIHKMDKETGNTIWIKGFMNDGHGPYIQMIKTTDGGYMATNSRNTNFTLDYPWGATETYLSMIVKMDVNGNKEWAKHFFRKSLICWDVICDIRQTADGGYITLTAASSAIPPWTYSQPYTEDMLVMKLDSSGNLEWVTKIVNANVNTYWFEYTLPSIYELADGYVFSCQDNNTGDFIVVKLGLTGSYVWGRTIDGNSFPEWASGVWYGGLQMTDTGFLFHYEPVGELGQMSVGMIETDFDFQIDGCPYILNGISNTVTEGYITEVLVEYDYMKIIESTYMWTFSQPIAIEDMVLEHHVVCPGGSIDDGLNCSEYFNGVDGSSPSTSIFTRAYGDEATIQNNSLSYTPETNPSPSWVATRYDANYQFNGTSFDYFISFDRYNMGGGMGGLELYAGDNFFVQILWGSYGMDDPVEYHATGSDEWQYYATTDTVGRLRLKRTSFGAIYAYVWNSALYRWEWNGNTNGLLLGTEAAPLQPYFRIFVYDQSTVRIPEYVVIDGCAYTTLL